MAQRRINAGWGVSTVEGYDILVAPADCALMGRDGWLIIGDKFYRVIVVDCSQKKHEQAMIANGLLLDTNELDLVHKKGWLILGH